MSRGRYLGFSGWRQAPARVGVVGFGRLGSIHAATIDRSSRAKLVGVCDIDRTTREQASAEHSVSTTDSLEDLLAMSLDAIVIASSSYSHAEQVIAAANAGVPVFVEKPLATTPAETERVRRVVQGSGVALQIGFQRRHDTRYKRLREIVLSGGIGQPILVKCFGSDPMPSRTPSGGSRGNGGLFVNSAIHDYDVVRYLLEQEVEAVTATGGSLGRAHAGEPRDIDACATTLVLDGGGWALTDWNRFSPDGFQAGLEVIGTRGRIQTSVTGGRSAARRSGTVIEAFEVAFRRSIASFIEAVRLDEFPTPTLDDAVRASEIAFAARRSFENGGELTKVAPIDEPVHSSSNDALT